MTALTTEARTTLTTALEATGLRVYTTVPSVPKPPAIVVVPDTPWVRPNRVGSNLNYEVRWRILVVIQPRQNAAEVLDTENAVDAVLAAIPAPYLVESVGAPQYQDVGAQGVVVTTEIAASVRMKE